MSTETQLNGQTYRIGRLNAFQQLHVSRKVGPLLPRLVPAFLAVAQDADAFGKPEQLAQMAAPFLDALAEMDDASIEYVAATCLSVVHRQQGASWGPVWNKQANCLMFDDVDLGTLLPLVVQVITENLGPFISGLLTGQLTPAQTSA